MSTNSIKFCENNFEQGTEALAKRLQQELEDAEVTIEFCLGHCGVCAEQPFAVVNDDLVTGDTVDDLYEAIVAYLE